MIAKNVPAVPNIVTAAAPTCVVSDSRHCSDLDVMLTFRNHLIEVYSLHRASFHRRANPHHLSHLSTHLSPCTHPLRL